MNTAPVLEIRQPRHPLTAHGSCCFVPSCVALF